MKCTKPCSVLVVPLYRGTTSIKMVSLKALPYVFTEGFGGPIAAV